MIKRAAFVLAFGALAACGQSTPTTAAPAVQLYAMDCGRANFPDVGMFADDHSFDGQARILVDPCYLIRHPDGDLIWDAGFPDAVADMEQGLEIPEMGTRVTMESKLVDQLAQLELTPADIEFVSFSHAHSPRPGSSMLTNALTCSAPKRAPTRRASPPTASWKMPRPA